MEKVSGEPEKLGLVLVRVLKNLGMERKISEASLVLNWEKIVGEKIAQEAKALKIEKKKLYLQVPNASWRNELFYLKKELIQKLNSFVKDTLIEDIIFLN